MAHSQVVVRPEGRRRREGHNGSVRLPAAMSVAELGAELDGLPAEIRELLLRHRFDRSRLKRLATRLGGETDEDNRVRGAVTAPADGDVSVLPPPGSAERRQLEEDGLAAIARGECALTVLAGGMATRMGGVIKALVQALDDETFLDLRLAEVRSIEQRSGGRVPLWLMTSHATDRGIREALGQRRDGDRIATFTQHLSVRLTPEGRLFTDDAGAPSLHAPGHGDLPDALKESGLLGRFVEGGGRVVLVANLDNLGATLDPAIVGWHLSHGKPVTCEVVDKVGSDRGGIPVRLDGRPVVLEEFRLPDSFDPTRVRVFNTNTFHFDARRLAELDMEFTFFTVKKNVSGKSVIQFERLIGEVTSMLDTAFLRVPRDGAESRFLPVKDHDELTARRGDIEAVARTRGMR